MHVPDLLTYSAACIYPDAHPLKTPYKKPGGHRILPAFSPTKYRYSKLSEKYQKRNSYEIFSGKKQVC